MLHITNAEHAGNAVVRRIRSLMPFYPNLVRASLTLGRGVPVLTHIT